MKIIKKIIIIVLALIIIFVLLRVDYVNQTKGKCLPDRGSCAGGPCNNDPNLKCNVFEILEHYFDTEMWLF